MHPTAQTVRLQLYHCFLISRNSEEESPASFLSCHGGALLGVAGLPGSPVLHDSHRWEQTRAV